MELRTGFFCPVLCHLLPALLMWKWHHDKDIMFLTEHQNLQMILLLSLESLEGQQDRWFGAEVEAGYVICS